MAGLCFRYTYCEQQNLKICMKWGVWHNVDLVCLVHESMNLEVVLTESYKTVYITKCCGSAGQL